MYNVKTFNAIAQAGLDEFRPGYQLNQTDDADALLIRSVDLHDYPFPKNLKAIVRCGAGFNNIPLDVATANGTAVFNTPGSNANAVKELVVAMLIIASRNLFSAARYAAANSGADISTRTEREKTQFNGTELAGKTLAVIGVGHVGARVATAAGALGMHVIGYDPYLSANDAWHIPTTTQRAATLAEALVHADYVSVHVPKNADTIALISTKELALMPKGAVLLNFARGGIVDNHAVCESLDAGHLKRYMTDFGEPEILNRQDVLVTPHIGGSTLQAEANGAVQGADTIMTFLETGNVMHSVNLPSLEVPFVGKYRLTIMHQNIPNMVGQIATLLAGANVNIESMSNAARDKVAYSIIDTNNEFDFDAVVAKLQAIDAVYRVRLLKK